MLEKRAFVEKSFAQTPSRVVLPLISLTLNTRIQAPEPEVVLIGDSNFDSQQIVTEQTSSRYWTSEVVITGDSEKLTNGLECE
jgi:hypothetical protein